MSITLPLVAYTDQTITDTTPVRAAHITEPRTNTQTVLTTLDAHIGKRGQGAHGDVSSEAAGFITPGLLNLLDSYSAQLANLEVEAKTSPIPAYSIAIWHGEANQVPTGWKTCDGTGGTPDLRSRIPVNWGNQHILTATGGSMSKSISLSTLLRSHNHAFNNCTYLSRANTGSYSRYTRYGQVYGDSWMDDWDNCTKSVQETSSSTGSSSGNLNVTITPPYVAKWYIQKQPEAEVELTTYMVSIADAENGSIVTNVSGRVTRGTRLVISAMPNPGYYPDHVYVNGDEVENDIIMYVYEDIEITATFAKVASGSRSFTTAGTYNWTVPQYIYKVRVAVCGGGGGCSSVVGGHHGWIDDVQALGNVTAGTGGTSSFGNLLSATGGAGGTCNWNTTTSAGVGGSPKGKTGSGGTVGTAYAYHSNTTSVGGSGFSLDFNATNNAKGYGVGSGCSFNCNSGDNIGSNAPGGSGGYRTAYLDVTPGTTYTITVGAKGANKYVNKGAYAWIVQNNTTGSSGFVLIAYGDGVE